MMDLIQSGLKVEPGLRGTPRPSIGQTQSRRCALDVDGPCREGDRKPQFLHRVHDLEIDALAHCQMFTQPMGTVK